MPSVESFRIAVPDDVLIDLRERLHRTRWPEPECVDDWSQGIPLAYVLAIVAPGCADYSRKQLDELIGATGQAPAVNQLPWSPWQHDPRLLEEHRARGVAVEGYSPLRGSRLRDPVLTAIAAAHGVTPAQVVLRWHLEHGIPVIPKSATRERIVSNLDLFGFSLSAEETARIDALSSR